MFLKLIVFLFICLLLPSCGYYFNSQEGAEYRISCVNLDEFLGSKKVEHIYNYSGAVFYGSEKSIILDKSNSRFDSVLFYSDVAEVSYTIVDSYMGLSRTEVPYKINGFDVLSSNIVRETDECRSESIYKQGGGDELLESFFTNNSADSIEIFFDMDKRVVVGVYDGGHSSFHILIRHPKNEKAVKGFVRLKSLPIK